MIYQVYQKCFSGRWYPLLAQRFSTRAAARAVIERMSDGDPARAAHFKVVRIGGVLNAAREQAAGGVNVA